MKEYYSTVEAAQICSVTRFSVINWTNQKILKSTKTPGGHRRIHRVDLIAFIKTYKIGVNEIKSESLIKKSDFLRCWEVHRSPSMKDMHDCKRCVVFLSDAKKCYTLREHMDHQQVYCKTTCVSCEYYQKVHLDQEDKEVSRVESINEGRTSNNIKGAAPLLVHVESNV